VFLKNLNITVESILSFLPQKLIFSKTLKEKRTLEYFNATLLFADISGFTKLSEKLLKLGKEGSEEINRIINNFFTPLINIVYKWDGDIYRFGGDAFLAFFPEIEGSSSSEERALASATEILNFVKLNSRTNTKIGSFYIKIHIGITKGKVYFEDLGVNFFLGGKVANSLLSLIEFAGPGEIVVTEEVKNSLPNAIFKIKENVFKFIKMKKKPKCLGKKKKDFKKIEDKFPIFKNYIPDWLLKRIELRPYFDAKDGEHRKIVILFLHFSGVPYDEELEKASLMLNNFYKIINETVKKYDGWINTLDVYKDSERILIIFGFPYAHEDDEKRAVSFAYEILNNEELKPFKIRIGINSGSVFIAPIGNQLRREYTVLGDAVNLTARLAANAEDNLIIVSESIFNKTFDTFKYGFLGEKGYKGKRVKINIYRLIGKKEFEGRLLEKWISESEKIVGRDKEMAKIHEIVELYKKGKGHIITIQGEPGIGKSRLAREIIKICNEKNFIIFEGSALSYGNAFSYYPWIQILNEFFNISPQDELEIKRAKIREKCLMIDKKLLEWLPVIGEVMSISFPETPLTKFLDAKLRKQRVFEIIFDFIKFVSTQKPVNIIIEDLQWADTLSLELINYISRNIKDKPIFLTLTYRPLNKKEEFMEKDWTTEIKLKELSKEDSIQLVKNLLNIEDIPNELRKVIITKSQGNPFYIEEMIKSLIEQGYIVEDKGTWKFKGDIKKLELSDSVEAVILSRIDRLDERGRDVLQVASVLGREFDEFLINGIYPQPQYLKKTLGNLERFDLIKQEKIKGEARYFFKHILTQEVAYSTLSFARRQELHQRVGTFIERELKNRKEEFLGPLSYHFYAGGNYDKSLLYSVEAGEKAKKVYANEEAIEFFTRAVESYEKLEKDKKQKRIELFISVLKARGEIYNLIGKYNKGIEEFNKIIEISPDKNKKIDALIGLASIKEKMGNYQDCINYIQEVIKLAKGKDMIDKKIKALNLKSIVLLKKGEYVVSRKISKQVIKILSSNIFSIPKEEQLEIKINALMNIGSSFWYIGNYKEAEKFYKICLKELKNTENKILLFSIFFRMGSNYLYQGKYKDAFNLYKKSLDISKKIMYQDGIINVLNNIGAAALLLGKEEEALKSFKSALKEAEKIQNKRYISRALDNIGICYAKKGNYNEAIKNFNKAGNIKKEIGDTRGYGTILINIAEVYKNMGDLKNALRYNKMSLDIFQKLKERGSEIDVMKNILEINELQNKEIEISYLKRLINEAYKLGNNETVFYLVRLLGNILIKKGLVKDAEKNYKKCLEIAENLNNPVFIAEAKISLAECFMKDIKNKKKIKEICDELKNYKKKIKERSTLFNIFKTIFYYKLLIKKNYLTCRNLLKEMREIVYRYKLFLLEPELLYLSSLFLYTQDKISFKYIHEAENLAKKMGLNLLLKEISKLKIKIECKAKISENKNHWDKKSLI